MTKSEFLAQENVPEFIKAIVASLPGDADVEIESFKLGKPQKKESCSCDRVHEDGVDISAYVEGIGDRVVALIDLCDDCRLKFLKMAVEHLERKVAAEKEGLNNDGEETDV